MMHRVTPVLRELLGLFVDDAPFALSVLAWLAVFAVLSPKLSLPLAWHGVLLFAGLAVILVGHCLRHMSHRTGHVPRGAKP